MLQYSVEIKIGVKPNNNVWYKPNTAQHTGNAIPVMKHGGGSIVLQGFLTTEGTQKTWCHHRKHISTLLRKTCSCQPEICIQSENICSNRSMSQSTGRKLQTKGLGCPTIFSIKEQRQSWRKCALRNARKCQNQNEQSSQISSENCH